MDDSPIIDGLPRHIFILVMCLVAGYVESVGFIELFGLFTSSITGNLTVAAMAVFHQDESVLARVLVTLCYALGAFAVSSCAHVVRRVSQLSPWDIGLISVALELLTMLTATALGVALTYDGKNIVTIQSWQCILTGSVLALAMGTQSAAVLLLVKDSPSTTVMTANITKASVAAADTLSTALCRTESESERHKHRVAGARFVEMSLVIVAFVVGAGAGAVITLNAGFWSLLVPDALLAAVMAGVCVGRAKQQHNENTVPFPADPTSQSAPAQAHEGTALSPPGEHPRTCQAVS